LYIYLDPDAAYAAAQTYAKEHGQSFAVTERTLWKMLSDKHLLATAELSRETYLIRKVLNGKRRSVLCFHIDTLSGLSDSAPTPTTDGDTPLSPTPDYSKFDPTERSTFPSIPTATTPPAVPTTPDLPPQEPSNTPWSGSWSGSNPQNDTQLTTENHCKNSDKHPDGQDGQVLGSREPFYEIEEFQFM
jgi:hypothetical protein